MNRGELTKLFDAHFIDECDEVYDAQNQIVEYAEKAVKLFAISDVSNRRELLLDFMTYVSPKAYATLSKSELADTYLSSNSY